MAPAQVDNNKKAVLEALGAHRGIISAACENVGLSRSTFYLWMNSDPEFKQAVEEINETAIDFVESKLLEKINGITVQTYNSKGDPVIYEQAPSDTAIIFYLKTKGKKRGYIEKSEVGFTDSEGKDVKPQLIFQPAPNCKPIDESGNTPTTE